jgi:hypothetical protein
LSAGYQRAYVSDSLGRPAQAGTTIGGSTYTFTADRIRDPDTLINSLGYASQLKAAATGQVYWTANARDAELHLTQ